MPCITHKLFLAKTCFPFCVCQKQKKTKNSSTTSRSTAFSGWTSQVSESRHPEVTTSKKITQPPPTVFKLSHSCDVKKNIINHVRWRGSYGAAQQHKTSRGHHPATAAAAIVTGVVYSKNESDKKSAKKHVSPALSLPRWNGHKTHSGEAQASAERHCQTHRRNAKK